MSVEIEGKTYQLEYDPQNPFVVQGLMVAYCHDLAEEYMPKIFDPLKYGREPCPPEFVAYRLVVDEEGRRLCVIYEVYWRRQDCGPLEMNKDHDHDYEQIQVHFDTKTGSMERVVVSAWGPLIFAGHGVEVYSNADEPEVRPVEYTTSPERVFPWGGPSGQNQNTRVTEIPIARLIFEDRRPIVIITKCYHIFTGYKGIMDLKPEDELDPGLVRLDLDLLKKWYYRHARNRFGHDLSKPFEEPHVMYSPPPEHWAARLFYDLIWLVHRVRRALGM